MPVEAHDVPRLGAIVLAGGRSRRMGQDKASLDWHGVPLVAHVAAALQAADGGGPTIVVARPGQALPTLPRDVETTEDPEPGRGPLMGLTAGLRALATRADLALIAATDQPFLDAAVFAPLIAAARRKNAAVWTTDRPQPLGAVYRITPCLAAAEAALAAGDGSLQALLRTVEATTLEADPTTTANLISLDTAEAYRAALSRS